MSKVFHIHLRTGLVTKEPMTSKAKERLLSQLQSKIDGNTYNIDQAIRKFASDEGLDIEIGSWAFGGRES